MPGPSYESLKRFFESAPAARKATRTLARDARVNLALAGGTAHGFRVPLADRWDVVWSATVWSIAAASLLLIAAGADSHLRPGARSEADRREGVSWLKRAIAATLVGLGLLLGRVSLHQHFNQNDLYHIAQMLGLYFLYRGALLLRGLGSPTSAPGQYHRPAST